MLKKRILNSKFELILIIFAFSISLFWASFNLNNFDNNKKNFYGNWYNQIAYHDIHAKWFIADNIRNDLKNGKSFFEAIPTYEKYFLPSVIAGTYYYVINQEMFIEKSNGQKVPKIDNYKFGLIFFQILLFYFSILIFSLILKKKVNTFIYKIILIFLCLEPSILQWHSTLWTESIFLSLMLLCFAIILSKTDSSLTNFILGILIGLLFLQRSVSVFYIVPVLIYYIIIFRLNIKPYLFLLLGYLLIIIFMGYNNYNKSGTFYVLSKPHQYYSFYHYFAHIIYADKTKITPENAKEILKKKENEWIKKNNLSLSILNDYEKIINYRNKVFTEVVISNPIFTFKFYLKKIATMAIIHPFWAHNHYFVDKSDPESKYNPKKYYHKYLIYNIYYSLLIYLFVFIGFILFTTKIIKKQIEDFDFFLIFNLISMTYFISISGFWGNPKYFAPCMISMAFFFAYGIEMIKNSYFNKKILKNTE